MKRIAVAGVASSLLLFSLAAAPAYAQEPVTAVYKCTQIEITNNTDAPIEIEVVGYVTTSTIEPGRSLLFRNTSHTWTWTAKNAHGTTLRTETVNMTAPCSASSSPGATTSSSPAPKTTKSPKHPKPHTGLAKTGV